MFNQLPSVNQSLNSLNQLNQLNQINQHQQVQVQTLQQQQQRQNVNVNVNVDQGSMSAPGFPSNNPSFENGRSSLGSAYTNGTLATIGSSPTTQTVQQSPYFASSGASGSILGRGAAFSVTSIGTCANARDRDRDRRQSHISTMTGTGTLPTLPERIAPQLQRAQSESSKLDEYIHSVDGGGEVLTADGFANFAKDVAEHPKCRPELKALLAQFLEQAQAQVQQQRQEQQQQQQQHNRQQQRHTISGTLGLGIDFDGVHGRNLNINDNLERETSMGVVGQSPNINHNGGTSLQQRQSQSKNGSADIVPVPLHEHPPLTTLFSMDSAQSQTHESIGLQPIPGLSPSIDFTQMQQMQQMQQMPSFGDSQVGRTRSADGNHITDQKTKLNPAHIVTGTGSTFHVSHSFDNVQQLQTPQISHVSETSNGHHTSQSHQIGQTSIDQLHANSTTSPQTQFGGINSFSSFDTNVHVRPMIRNHSSMDHNVGMSNNNNNSSNNNNNHNSNSNNNNNNNNSDSRPPLMFRQSDPLIANYPAQMVSHLQGEQRWQQQQQQQHQQQQHQQPQLQNLRQQQQIQRQMQGQMQSSVQGQAQRSRVLSVPHDQSHVQSQMQQQQHQPQRKSMPLQQHLVQGIQNNQNHNQNQNIQFIEIDARSDVNSTGEQVQLPAGPTSLAMFTSSNEVINFGNSVPMTHSVPMADANSINNSNNGNNGSNGNNNINGGNVQNDIGMYGGSSWKCEHCYRSNPTATDLCANCKRSRYGSNNNYDGHNRNLSHSQHTDSSDYGGGGFGPFGAFDSTNTFMQVHSASHHNQSENTSTRGYYGNNSNNNYQNYNQLQLRVDSKTSGRTSVPSGTSRTNSSPRNALQAIQAAIAMDTDGKEIAIGNKDDQNKNSMDVDQDADVDGDAEPEPESQPEPQIANVKNKTDKKKDNDTNKGKSKGKEKSGDVNSNSDENKNDCNSVELEIDTDLIETILKDSDVKKKEDSLSPESMHSNATTNIKNRLDNSNDVQTDIEDTAVVGQPIGLNRNITETFTTDMRYTTDYITHITSKRTSMHDSNMDSKVSSKRPSKTSSIQLSGDMPPMKVRAPLVPRNITKIWQKYDYISRQWCDLIDSDCKLLDSLKSKETGGKIEGLYDAIKGDSNDFAFIKQDHYASKIIPLRRIVIDVEKQQRIIIEQTIRRTDNDNRPFVDKTYLTREMAGNCDVIDHVCKECDANGTNIIPISKKSMYGIINTPSSNSRPGTASSLRSNPSSTSHLAIGNSNSNTRFAISETKLYSKPSTSFKLRQNRSGSRTRSIQPELDPVSENGDVAVTSLPMDDIALKTFKTKSKSSSSSSRSKKHGHGNSNSDKRSSKSTSNTNTNTNSNSNNSNSGKSKSKRDRDSKKSRHQRNTKRLSGTNTNTNTNTNTTTTSSSSSNSNTSGTRLRLLNNLSNSKSAKSSNSRSASGQGEESVSGSSYGNKYYGFQDGHGIEYGERVYVDKHIQIDSIDPPVKLTNIQLEDAVKQMSMLNYLKQCCTNRFVIFAIFVSVFCIVDTINDYYYVVDDMKNNTVDAVTIATIVSLIPLVLYWLYFAGILAIFAICQRCLQEWYDFDRKWKKCGSYTLGHDFQQWVIDTIIERWMGAIKKNMILKIKQCVQFNSDTNDTNNSNTNNTNNNNNNNNGNDNNNNNSNNSGNNTNNHNNQNNGGDNGQGVWYLCNLIGYLIPIIFLLVGFVICVLLVIIISIVLLLKFLIMFCFYMCYGLSRILFYFTIVMLYRIFIVYCKAFGSKFFVYYYLFRFMKQENAYFEWATKEAEIKSNKRQVSQTEAQMAVIMHQTLNDSNSNGSGIGGDVNDINQIHKQSRRGVYNFISLFDKVFYFQLWFQCGIQFVAFVVLLFVEAGSQEYHEMNAKIWISACINTILGGMLIGCKILPYCKWCKGKRVLMY